MKTPDFKDDQLGPLRSIVILLLVLVIVYLGLLLPWSPRPEAVGGAILALSTLIGAIFGASTWRRR